MNNFDPIANRLGYTREQMIAKHGERGTKPLSEIAEAEGLKLSELTQDTYSGQKTSGYNPSDIFGEGFDNNNNDLAGLLKMLGQLVERLFKLLGADNEENNGENNTQNVKDSANDFSYIWDGEFEEEAINIFTSGSENIFLDDNGSIPVSELTTDSKNVSGKKTTSKKTSSKKTSSKKTSSKKTSDNSNNAENKKIKTIANKTGYDKKTVSAVVKAAATGQYTGKPESVVPKMAMDLGLPQEAVANILKELNNGSI